MHFRLLALTLLLLSGVSLANGRSPAVEDFVGIEVDQPHAVPHGAESLFNLEKDIQHIEQAHGKDQLHSPQFNQSNNSPVGISSLLAIILILALPAFSLLLVMHHLKQKASKESASNIEVLENYRRERELAKKRQLEQERKVS